MLLCFLDGHTEVQKMERLETSQLGILLTKYQIKRRHSQMIPIPLNSKRFDTRSNQHSIKQQQQKKNLDQNVYLLVQNLLQAEPYLSVLGTLSAIWIFSSERMGRWRWGRERQCKNSLLQQTFSLKGEIMSSTNQILPVNENLNDCK